jgi:hypothetical protein
VPFGRQAQTFARRAGQESHHRLNVVSLDILEIDKEEAEKIKSDEIALMKFGFKYLKYILMLEETLKVKDEYKKEERSLEV